MFQRKIIILLISSFLFACSAKKENAIKVPDDIVPIDTMAAIMADIHLAEAEAALAREKQNVKTAEINTNRSLFALAMLLQLPDYKNFDIQEVPVNTMLDAPLFTAENIIAKAYENQPQVKAAESRIKSAEAQTEVTKTAVTTRGTRRCMLLSFEGLNDHQTNDDEWIVQGLHFISIRRAAFHVPLSPPVNQCAKPRKTGRVHSPWDKKRGQATSTQAGVSPPLSRLDPEFGRMRSCFP